MGGQSVENRPAIEVQGLAKSFGDIQSVAGIAFEVGEGEIFGFLGPNGAGKTTTINMLTGLARPMGGHISYFGRDYTKDIKKAQHLMGIVADESNLYPELTGFENLCFCASLYGIRRKEREQRAKELLESFGLAEAAHRKFAGYSRGMKRRLTIAAGIIHRPKILFLDEPTSGIDVASARQIRKLVSDLKAGGTTVFLTTHYIEEAERLCDRIAFIVNGRIVRIGATSELLKQTKDEHIIELTMTKPLLALPPGIELEFAHITFQLQAGNKMRAVTKTAISLAPLIRYLEERDIMVTEARAIQPSLEEVFVQITGIEAGKMKAEKERKGQP
jgi:ABC-2 type transport system ATP-binding protein